MGIQVTGKNGTIRDYVKLAAPEPDVLRTIGEESARNKTNTIASRQIDEVIKATRVQRRSASASDDPS
jgi:hypothetical protein